MRHRLVVIAAAVAILIASSASAQISNGVARTPGVTFHPAPAAPPPPAHPPRSHGRPDLPQPEGTSPRRTGRSGSDLFLAGPHTYSPRDGKRSRLRPHLYGSPYALPVPYFLPGDYPAALASTVAAPAYHPAYAPIDSGYLVLRMEPSSAMVYIDGFFVGAADEIGARGYALEPGPHRVELKAEGFETAAFDVRVRANDTITYTRDLERPAPTSNAARALPQTGTSILQPVVIAQTATPKTLYVIPRCYAGDRRPAASELPSHCKLADLRTIR